MEKEEIGGCDVRETVAFSSQTTFGRNTTIPKLDTDLTTDRGREKSSASGVTAGDV
jgi:hypothetical protein